MLRFDSSRQSIPCSMTPEDRVADSQEWQERACKALDIDGEQRHAVAALIVSDPIFWSGNYSPKATLSYSRFCKGNTGRIRSSRRWESYAPQQYLSSGGSVWKYAMSENFRPPRADFRLLKLTTMSATREAFEDLTCSTSPYAEDSQWRAFRKIDSKTAR